MTGQSETVQGSKPHLSVVVVSYNMDRELPRTLFTLHPPYQQGLENVEVEVIVVDNGSKKPPQSDEFPGNVRVLQVANQTHSPVPAVNLGLAEARADFIGVMIDGARLASPGMFHFALLASKLHERPVVSTLGFHLGPDVQMRSVENGYCQEQEDQLLSTVDWRENGYELFSISVFAGSSSQGWFKPISESNALFMPRVLWDELGGFDERFAAPGGGLANLDVYTRACELPDTEFITLLGEGTFHQVHGGIATNLKRPDASWASFHEEYVGIRGKDFANPTRAPIFLGTLPPQALPDVNLPGQEVNPQTKKEPQ